jgi:hypothetical protein
MKKMIEANAGASIRLVRCWRRGQEAIVSVKPAFACYGILIIESSIMSLGRGTPRKLRLSAAESRSIISEHWTTGHEHR